MIKMKKYTNEDLARTAAAIINQHNATVNTMLIKIKDQYFGFQPNIPPQKKLFPELSDERSEELMMTFQAAYEFLSVHGATLLVCFTNLNEGGAIVHLSKEGYAEREMVMAQLEKMEVPYAKISKH